VTTYEITSVELQPRLTAVVRGHVEQPDLPAFLGAAFGETIQVITAQQHTPAGPPFARYRMSGTGFDVEAGFPSPGPVAGTGRVEASELPGGPSAEVLHRGDYAAVGEAYAAAGKWLAEHRYTPNGDAWEEYLDEPGVAEPRTVVHMPYRAG
jgi:effector-binding domain-containing protein